MRAVLLVLCASCATNLAASLDESEPKPAAGKVFGVPGEVIEYRVTMRGVTVGTVQIGVGLEGYVDGKRAVVIKSRATTAGVIEMLGSGTWELTTTLDIDAGLPMRSTEDISLDLAGEHERAHDERTWTDGDRRHNLHSVAGWVRAWQGGDRTELDVLVHDHTFSVEVSEVAHELLETTKRPAVRYEGKRDRYSFVFWISDDVARVPLLMRAQTKVGEMVVELVDYQAPVD